ncbi:MAG: hypothetical protein ABI912_09600 [Actinomycetota bacterium]
MTSRRGLVAALATVSLVAMMTPAAHALAPAGAPACPSFPADNVWHSDISRLPVSKHNAAWMASTSASTRKLHPDFGTSGNPAAPYGIPYISVAGTHPKVPVTFYYADESDHVSYPLGADTKVEGGRDSGGDMHAIEIDRATCKLYETSVTTQDRAGRWHAAAGAVWDLKSNRLRPATWTSSDAAGLPIYPGLLRRDEVKAGLVDHAIRFTLARTDRSFVWPARHQAGSARSVNLPPMGARFRLKASFNISRLRPDTQVVLKAMKKHGVILADNGSNWFFQGAADNNWDDGFINELKGIPASAFEAVDASSQMVSVNSGQARKTP